MEAAWAVVAAVLARAEKCVSPFSHYKPTADLTPFFFPVAGRWSKNTSFLNGPRHPQETLCIVPPLSRFSEGFVNAPLLVSSACRLAITPNQSSRTSCSNATASSVMGFLE